MSKLITVFGATGKQGNAVATACLANGFKVRALTRNPNSDKAYSLVQKGFEVVKVDMDSSGSLQAAIAGSYAVFAVTNILGLLAENPDTALDREIAQGKAIGDGCKKEGVKHLIFSGDAHIEELLGKKCDYYDGKAIVEKYLCKIEVPCTIIHVAFYYENFCDFAPPEKGKDGTYTMTYPLKGPMSTISVSDIGRAVVTIIKNPNEYMGKTLELCGDSMTMGEYAAIMSEVTGKTVKYNQLTLEAFSKLPIPGIEDLVAMYEFVDSVPSQFHIELTRKLNPDVATFRLWVEKNKDKLLT